MQLDAPDRGQARRDVMPVVRDRRSLNVLASLPDAYPIFEVGFNRFRFGRHDRPCVDLLLKLFQLLRNLDARLTVNVAALSVFQPRVGRPEAVAALVDGAIAAPSSPLFVCHCLLCCLLLFPFFQPLLQIRRANSDHFSKANNRKSLIPNQIIEFRSPHAQHLRSLINRDEKRLPLCIASWHRNGSSPAFTVCTLRFMCVYHVAVRQAAPWLKLLRPMRGAAGYAALGSFCFPGRSSLSPSFNCLTRLYAAARVLYTLPS